MNNFFDDKEIITDSLTKVFAREIIEGKPTRIGGLRHDYSLEPPSDTLLNILEKTKAKL